MEFFGKNVLFVRKLIAMTLNKEIGWQHYKEGLFQFNDENLVFFHHEFCWLDSLNSFYTKIENTIVLLVYEISDSGKDGSINCLYRIYVAEPGDNGYIEDVPIPENYYSSVAELSYHIKGLLGKRNSKAEKFIDNIVGNDMDHF